MDDIDHLGNRRVRAVGELLENQFRIGLVRMERAIKERMSVYQEMSTAMPHDLINAKPVAAAFASSSARRSFRSSWTRPIRSRKWPTSGACRRWGRAVCRGNAPEVVYLVGNATPGATVTNTVDTWPDGTTHGPYSATANGSGTYSMGPYILQQLGTYHETVHDSISGQTINITYSGTGDFSTAVSAASQTVTKGQSASYTVTFGSVNGFAGTVVPAALNWSQVPGATGSWSPLQVTVPAGGSVQAVFTIQTSSSTTAGTYSNITLQGANGSVTHAASPASLTVSGGTGTLTASLSPASPTVGVTNVYLVGNATPGATVTNTVDTWPDGTTHGPYSATANGSGTYSMGPYILQQLGTYHETVQDSISGQTINITYSGTGDFSTAVSAASQTVTKGQSASYAVTFSSVSGFAGTVVPAALNWSQVPGATGSWSPLQVTVPAGGSVQAVFTIQTSSSTTAGTYSNITLQGANGSVTHAASPASLTVSGSSGTLTASLSPSSPTVGLTNAYLVGNATPGATVTNTVDTWPDGTIHGPYSATANGSGAFSMGPYILQQLGTYHETVQDSISGQTINITYSGTGDFSTAVSAASQTVTKGQSASYTVTFSSVNGFAGTVVPAALNWSQVPGATASWSPLQVTVPSGGSVQAVFTIQTSSGTTAGTYSNITLQGANGSVTHAASPVSLTVSGGTNGPPSGTIKASPTTCQVSTVGGMCSISLVWTLQNTTAGLISVTDALGTSQAVGPVSGAGSSQPISWIRALPESYTFYLWDYTGGAKGAQLSSVAVSATGPSASASTPSVAVDPTRNTPGSAFNIYGSGLATGQASIFVQPPGGSGNSVAQVSVGPDGTFNYPYTTQASSVTGIYTVWATDANGRKSSSGTFTLIPADASEHSDMPEQYDHIRLQWRPD